MWFFILERTKKDAICNVPLPPTQPLASPDDQVAQRLFIVLSAVGITVPCPITISYKRCFFPIYSELAAFDIEEHILLLVGTDRCLPSAQQELWLRQVCGG